MLMFFSSFVFICLLEFLIFMIYNKIVNKKINKIFARGAVVAERVC